MPHHHPARSPKHLHAATPPVPCPPAGYLNFPADDYAHPGAPSEWWWHVGTLRAGERIFGFEINAQTFMASATESVYFVEVMLTDVANQTHFSNVVAVSADPDWAESNPAQPWYVRLSDEAGANSISMTAAADPGQNMVVDAAFIDPTASSPVPISFSLSLSQQGPPLQIWGTGVSPTPPKPGGVTTNNYYYSFTRLQASGTLTIAGESFEVSGLTWMDHEYGFFGTATQPVTWMLQAMQLTNGFHIHHYYSFEGQPPKPNQTVSSFATIQGLDGALYYQTDCTMTMGDRLWMSPSGKFYFMEFTARIPDFGAELIVTALVENQLFNYPGGTPETYEGVASVSGTFEGTAVTGTGWIEQNF